jgi:hypothetical protein
MSTATRHKIFGISLAFDPKWLLAGVIFLALILVLHDLGGNDVVGSNSSQSAGRYRDSPAVVQKRSHQVRARQDRNIRSSLKYVSVDASAGNIDPRLRFDLLTRLQKAPEPKRSRSLFEVVAREQPVISGPLISPNVPTVPVSDPPVMPVQAAVLPAIPLKYYGFLKSSGPDKSKQGFFLDGSDIVVGAQGDILEQRYRLLQLSAESAQVEDLESKASRILPAPPDLNK